MWKRLKIWLLQQSIIRLDSQIADIEIELEDLQDKLTRFTNELTEVERM